MAAELRVDVGALRHDREALLARIADEGIDQRGGNALPADLWRHERVIGDPRLASLAFATLWVLGWYVALAWLYRRGVVWKV